MIDFVFPERKLFPITNPEDITAAIEIFHLFEDEISYESFVFRLSNVAKRGGKEYIAKLPEKIKGMTGIRKYNKPEQPLKKSNKKPKSRFKEKRYED